MAASRKQEQLTLVGAKIAIAASEAKAKQMGIEYVQILLYSPIKTSSILNPEIQPRDIRDDGWLLLNFPIKTVPDWNTS